MNDIKRLRRPSAGGYVRGDETRLRIIAAAIELFGEHGFESASTREIAARAGVNAPALQYYFENKEGVYRACVEHMADEAWTTFGPVIEHAADVLQSDPGIPELIDAFIKIQGTLADRMFQKACGAPNHRLFFAREQGGREPAIGSEILTRRLRRPLNAVCSQLIARISGTTPNDPVTLVRMLTLQGQLALFHISPRTTFDMLGWKEIDAEKGEMLKAIVGKQTRILLQLWSEEGLASRENQAKHGARALS